MEIIDKSPCTISVHPPTIGHNDIATIELPSLAFGATVKDGA